MGVGSSVHFPLLHNIVRELKIPFDIVTHSGTYRINEAIDWCSRNVWKIDGRFFDPNWGFKHGAKDLINQRMFWTGEDRWTAAEKISTAIAGVPDDKLYNVQPSYPTTLARSPAQALRQLQSLQRWIQRWIERRRAVDQSNAPDDPLFA